MQTEKKNNVSFNSWQDIIDVMYDCVQDPIFCIVHKGALSIHTDVVTKKVLKYTL